MKTKNIFKTVALAMMMPAMLLTTACSNQDDVANTSNITNKGYALPITVNVTRGDGATRATYNDGTKTLAFSAGDKLFVEGINSSVGGPGLFSGELIWQSGGTFSGTIYTQNSYSGTADALFTAASASGSVNATLLPNGYESYKFLTVFNKGSVDLYDDGVAYNMQKAFVASETAKATGVEQLSWEKASTYSSGFALAPENAVLNFTISGLEAGAQDVTLSIVYGGVYTVTGSVTPNASGVATFAIGVPAGANINNMDNNLTVGTHNFTLPSSTIFTAGKIYNISRSVTPAGPTAYTLAESTVGMIVGSDGNAYAVEDKDNLPSGVTAVGMVAYKGTNDASTGSVIALTDESDIKMSWADAQTACANKASVGGYSWQIPDTWIYMFGSFGGDDYNCTGLNTALVNAGGDALKSGSNSVTYWTKLGDDGYNMYVFTGGSTYSSSWESDPSYLRLYFDFDE